MAPEGQSDTIFDPAYRAWLERRERLGRMWKRVLIAATWFGVAMLAILLLQVLYQSVSWVVIEERERRGKAEPVIVRSLPLHEGFLQREQIAHQLEPNQVMILKFWLSADFLRQPPSRLALNSGISSALWGSIWLLVMVAVLALPLGIGAALYLEEFAPQNWLTEVIQTNVQNLAGVPSIIYGILGLAAFVRALEAITQGRSLLAGALTMTLLVLPIVIIAAREAIRAVPNSIREASYGMGATRWQTMRYHVLPAALPGILTGAILALSRAIGETAPLIMIGALTYIKDAPQSLVDRFTVMPIQIFNWTSLPQAEFRNLAAAGIILLLAVLLSMNAVAIFLRNRYRIRW